MGNLNKELLETVENFDDERYENPQYVAQVVRPNKTEKSWDDYEATLHKAGVSTKVIAKARAKAWVTIEKGGTPYVRVDDNLAKEEAAAAKREAKIAAKGKGKGR